MLVHCHPPAPTCSYQASLAHTKGLTYRVPCRNSGQVHRRHSPSLREQSAAQGCGKYQAREEEHRKCLRHWLKCPLPGPRLTERAPRARPLVELYPSHKGWKMESTDQSGIWNSVLILDSAQGKSLPSIDPKSHDQRAAGPGIKWDGMQLLDCTEEFICMVSSGER